MTITLAFRPYSGEDIEEKAESDALHRALLRHIPAPELRIIERRPPDGITHRFGRSNNLDYLAATSLVYPGTTWQATGAAYWDWPAFRSHANREFEVVPIERAQSVINRFHAARKDVFVKSTRQKHLTETVPVGSTLLDAIDAMAYEFADGGPELIVQEFVEISAEYRLFIVDGQVVTGAGKIMEHTPDDHVAADFGPFGLFVPDEAGAPVNDPDLVRGYVDFARSIASGLPDRHTNIDVALINGAIGIVEANPLELGQIGLFGSDIDLLTEAVLRSLELID